jgi:uncharacterized phage infection (PIP) family protein YhgE
MSGTRTAAAAAATAAIAAAAFRQLTAAGYSVPGSAPNCASGALAEISNQLNQASATLNTAIQSLASLPNEIERQVNQAINVAVSTVIGPIQAEANRLATELHQLLQFLNDPVRFLAQWINMQTLFPNLNLRALIDRLLTGLGICSVTPSGAPSNTVAAQGPTPTSTPSAPSPSVTQNTSAQSQQAAAAS